MAGKSGLILMFGAGLALLLLSGDRPLPTDARVPQDSSQTGLLEAVRRADLKRSCELLLDDQDGAERLFLRILEDTIGTAASEPGKAVRLEHARRLADVFFLIYEFDFERGIVSWWEKEPPSRKRELLAILRDHYAAYRDSRSMSRRLPQPFDKQKRLLTTCLSLADRYREMSFGKGELQALLRVCPFDPDESGKAWQLAKSLHDDVGEAWAAYHFGIWAAEGEPEAAAEHAVAAAEKLKLPRLSQLALTRQAWRLFNIDDYDGYVDHLRRGLEVIRTMPMPPAQAGPRSDRMSPKRLLATTTSNQSGCWTKCAVRMSMWN